MPHPYFEVPDTRAADPGRASVPNLDASPRDLRWDRSNGRAMVGAMLVELIALLWLFGAWLFGDSMTDPLIIGAATLVWAVSGPLRLGTHSTAMAPRMAKLVRAGLDTWRALPEPARARSAAVAQALIDAGARHDVAGAQVRFLALDRLARIVAAQDPGLRDDVDELNAWTDATEETHRAD